jgi:hypothetical protein
MLCRSLFVLFPLAIVLSVLLRYTDSDYLPLVSSNSSSTQVYICYMLYEVLFVSFVISEYFPRWPSTGADPGFVVRGGGVSRRGVWGPLKVPSWSRVEPW